MAILISQALEIIVPVLDALLAAQGTMPTGVRQQVEALVRQHGPQIATVSQWDAPSRIAAFLDDLSLLRPALPPAVVAALADGGSAAARREVPVLSAERRQEVLARLVALADFRVFADPAGLAQEVITLVTRHLDRLLLEERTSWQALVEEFNRAKDANAFLQGVSRLLADYPAVRALLDARRQWAPGPVYRSAPRGELAPKGVPFEVLPTERAVAPAVEATDEVVRYANVNFPNKVFFKARRVTLLIQVARQLEAWSRTTADEARLSLKLAPLTLVVTAEDFALDAAVGGEPVEGTPWARQVRVLADKDCDPVAFLLSPQAVGVKKVQIDFYQFNRNILTLVLQTEVTDRPEALEDLSDLEVKSPAITSPALGAQAPVPDLELRVILSADRTRLFYLLHAPKTRDYHWKNVGSVELGADPQTFLKPIFERLSTLARLSAAARSAGQAQAALQELDDIGINLYDQLFPAELKEEYGKRLRTAYRGKGLLITSDDPWIPWEMVKPYEFDEQGNERFNDPPLCVMFNLSRWLAGRGAPDLVRIRNGVWVAPADNLQAAREESEYFAELRRKMWSLNLEGPLSTVADVDARFRQGDTEHYHFACHGNFNTDDPNESKLKLADGFLRPSQLIGPKQAGLRRSRPLVFLNACHSGRVGAGLTHLGGWAQKMVDSGASAFIGSLWEINDQLAARFAREFYDRFFGAGAFQGKPLPLGEAFHQARLAIKEADPANPTWLAYVLYGDPYGQVALGGA
ncbi:MAG: CHAT domain-containing protein [Anaerolineae bacterium]